VKAKDLFSPDRREEIAPDPPGPSPKGEPGEPEEFVCPSGSHP